jgi:hypothetical protein
MQPQIVYSTLPSVATIRSLLYRTERSTALMIAVFMQGAVRCITVRQL